METTTTHYGATIYKGMKLTESPEELDKVIVKNTLDYYEFIAEMSDDYRRTLEEKERIYQFKKKYNL